MYQHRRRGHAALDLGLAELHGRLGETRKVSEYVFAEAIAQINGRRFPFLGVVGLDGGLFGKQVLRFTSSEGGREQEVFGPILVGKAAQVFRHFNLMLRLGNRLAIPFILEPLCHPAVHCLAHGLVIVVAGVKDGVLDFFRNLVEREHFRGPVHAPGRLAHAKLIGVFRRVDHHEGAGCHER